MKIALAGNPNSGKTTMFNALTGKSEKVGNWAGVTVDKKEHTVKRAFSGEESIIVVDLPGAYSMSPFTSEESVTRDYVKNEKPEAIINIVDATNLSRSLFFTTQLLELGIPIVVALNKTDANKKKNNMIDAAALSEKLGCTVVETVSTTGKGLKEAIAAAVGSIGKEQTAPYSQTDIDLNDRIAVEEADKKRFEFINGIVKDIEKRTTLTKNTSYQDKIDAVITSKWLGIPIFAAVMFAVFWISQAGPGAWVSDWLTGLLEKGQGYLGELMKDANPLLYALLIDGVIGGVIAVIGFLPLVMIMYFLIALLEDCGYMARVSVVLDPIFKKVGLSGKSVIPFVVGTGCAVPGVMACRTIKNDRERRATAMLAPFMPCGAKLPIIAALAGAFFKGSTWVGPLMYFTGIVIILIGALLVNAITGNRKKKSYFIIELPEYKLPSLWNAIGSMCQRGWSFIVKAATVILICNTAVQIMQSFTWSFRVADNASDSILASVGGPFAYMLVPIIGFSAWQMAAATITGFIAKENVIGTLAVCYAMSDVASELPYAAPQMTAVAGLAFLMFNLFTPPCFAAIGAMSSEMKSSKWLFSGLALQLGMGFTIGYLVYTIGTIIVSPSALAVVPAICGGTAVLMMLITVTALCIRGNRSTGKK
jgi:ferrous iron transport protein B